MQIRFNVEIYTGDPEADPETWEGHAYGERVVDMAVPHVGEWLVFGQRQTFRDGIRPGKARVVRVTRYADRDKVDVELTVFTMESVEREVTTWNGVGFVMLPMGEEFDF